MTTLWTPPADWRERTRIGQFVQFAESRTGRTFADYDELWRWSVDAPEEFWAGIWEHFNVSGEYETVLADAEMPGARWFPGARINYARQLLDFRGVTAEDTAVIGVSQTRPQVTLTFAELIEQVGRARNALVQLGVRRGDRVVAYLPNIPETLVAFLATASLGAVWASCAPEFGARSVLDRFRQLAPTVLLTVSGYTYGSKAVDRRAEVAAIRDGLPSLWHVVEVDYGPERLPDARSWTDLLGAAGSDGLHFEPVPFDHPLFVLFSSGTTGQPKAIVHGHGGILLEHLKNHALSWDLGPGDRLLWFTTTAWMMWNALVSALLVDTSIVMIDGNPMHPGLDFQWRLASETQATFLGASPGFLMATRKAGLNPGKEFDLSRVRQIGAAGSPLPTEGYEWVYEQFDVLLNVGSGGTDVCSGIVQGSPIQPVVAGEISGPCLGFDAQAWDDSGQRIVGELGELVITKPVPSMPIGFWGDTNGERYRSTYFDRWPGVWRHGDWIRFSESGSCVIAGRSDATLNRGGVRLGTAEFYRVLEELPDVEDSLVVHLEDPQGGNGELLLFVVLSAGADAEVFEREVGRELRQALSPRHVPDTVVVVPAVPRNRTGKKLELPIKRILQGRSPEEVASVDSLAEADSLEPYVEFAKRRGALA